MNPLGKIVLVMVLVAAGTYLFPRTAAQDRKLPVDDPTAHALYDRMVEAMRAAETLSFTSRYRWEARGKELGHCTYTLLLEKPYYFVPDALFVWKPPPGWKEWRKPRPGDRLLKPGEPAPDFTLTLVNGDKITLSDLRGKVAWLNIWRAG
jgi:hypothetical protein